MEPHPHLTNIVLMVSPSEFGFNAQTAVDNQFQHKPKDTNTVQSKAIAEFDTAVKKLRHEGVTVLVLQPKAISIPTPDAVFPNNWISTDPNGNVYIYPMATPNRRAETERLTDVLDLFEGAHLVLNKVIRLDNAPFEGVLEGTGSMVIDHVNNTLYAALSVRTDKALALQYAKSAGYAHTVFYHSESRKGKEFYHTNVLMAIGKGFAVVALDNVPDINERNALSASLSTAGLEVIDITQAQAEEHFCGNIIQLDTAKGHTIIVLSSTAYNGFTDAQRITLTKYGKLVPLDIETIEYIGGGSARCMLAEIFLPQKP